MENPNFRLKAIADFLDGNHHFFIPSYQRGYRWDKKQVEDLLKDIWDFAKDDTKKKGDFYCLQPIVVKQKINSTEWIVIDGQQRLTTLLLILEYIKKISSTPFVKQSSAYEIKYETRPVLDFSNPVIDTDIDSFHVYQAKEVIENWYSAKANEIRFSLLEDVLFLNNNSISQVKAIWYVAENNNDLDAIRTFNNLNKGKIRLTNAELIKALFILRANVKNEEKTEDIALSEFSFEWNEIENSLQDDRFWYFLVNKDYNPATRIDVLFDFITQKSKNDDGDFAYRKFQELYDGIDSDVWKNIDVVNFTSAWRKIKEVYHTFVYWYEEPTLYHYIGYLINYNVPLQKIYNECKGISKRDLGTKLRKLITEWVLHYEVNDIDEFTYTEKKSDCHKILLFFNIQSCLVHQNNLNKIVENIDTKSYYKFPFDLFKIYSWDIEHVGSRKDNPLTEIKDKKVWLSYIPDIKSDHKDWPEILKDTKLLITELNDTNKDKDFKFKSIYEKVTGILQGNSNDSKDTIENLTLLDSGTNRGYQNALFASKRQSIIERDSKGVFIPPCTRNLFLKYYTRSDEDASQWRNIWNDNDREKYLKAIHNSIDSILIKPSI